MKRLIIILDALRYDYAKNLILPEFKDCKIHKLSALGYSTLPVFAKIGYFLSTYKGNVVILGGRGLPEMTLCRNFILKDKEPPECPFITEVDKIGVMLMSCSYNILIIHGYHIHNWPFDVTRKQSEKCCYIVDKQAGIEAYTRRVKDVVTRLKQVVEEAKKYNWEIFITSDHGEALWDDGIHYGHSLESHMSTPMPGVCPDPDDGYVPEEVRVVPVIDFQNYKKIDFNSLFSGGKCA